MSTLTPGLKRLVDSIEKHKEHISVLKAAELVEKANISETDLEPWSDYLHPLKDGYGRKLAFHNEHYEIMIMSWNPGDFSNIHDHGYTQWGAVQVFGNVMHHTFSNTGKTFKLSKKEILPVGSIVKVNNALIHQMGNVTSKPYLTLHMYGANEPHHTVTGDMKVYELETGLIRKTDGGAFFNLTDEDAPIIGSMKPIEKETFVHQVSILLPYYCRYTPDEISSKRLTLLHKIEQIACDR